MYAYIKLSMEEGIIKRKRKEDAHEHILEIFNHTIQRIPIA